MSLACPDSEVLERFLLGQCPDEGWGELAAHVEVCPECIGRLGTIRVADPFESALQSAPSTLRGPSRIVEEWILQKVIEDVGDTNVQSSSPTLTAAPLSLPTGVAPLSVAEASNGADPLGR